MKDQLISVAGELGLPTFKESHADEYSAALQTMQTAMDTLADMDG